MFFFIISKEEDFWAFVSSRAWCECSSIRVADGNLMNQLTTTLDTFLTQNKVFVLYFVFKILSAKVSFLVLFYENFPYKNILLTFEFFQEKNKFGIFLLQLIFLINFKRFSQVFKFSTFVYDEASYVTRKACMKEKKQLQPGTIWTNIDVMKMLL